MVASPLGSSALSALVAGALALSGCEVFKRSDETVAVVNQKAVGLAAGDFFDRYGKARSRFEVQAGTEYVWESESRPLPPGASAPDDRICRLRLSTDRRGLVVGAIIMFDGQGRTSTSRCREIFH